MRVGIQMGNFFCTTYQNFLINDLNRVRAPRYAFARNPIHVAMFSIFPGEPEARFVFSQDSSMTPFCVYVSEEYK